MTASIVFPQNKALSLDHPIVRILGASLLIAVSAQIEIMLPFTPVSLTLQTFTVLLVGAMLGRKAGVLAVLAYLTEVSAGLPVLAGGTINPLAIVGPTSGYLLGFIAQAYIAGWIMEKNSPFSSTFAFTGLAVGCAVQLSMGMICLVPFVGTENVLYMGLLPFIPGEVFKCLALTFALKKRHEKQRPYLC